MRRHTQVSLAALLQRFHFSKQHLMGLISEHSSIGAIVLRSRGTTNLRQCSRGSTEVQRHLQELRFYYRPPPLSRIRKSRRLRHAAPLKCAKVNWGALHLAHPLTLSTSK
jgi:hypothetical protein